MGTVVPLRKTLVDAIKAACRVEITRADVMLGGVRREREEIAARRERISARVAFIDAKLLRLADEMEYDALLARWWPDDAFRFVPIGACLRREELERGLGKG
jgi:hypothetical protein